MQRVLIIGSPGAGKSTLARELAERTGLPLVHLDQLYWRPHWTEPVKDEWKARLVRELEKPAWIMDGSYGGTLEMRLAYADTVILFDFPTHICLYRALKRTVTSYGKVRFDMADECPERLDAEFFLYIARFRRERSPRLLAALQGFDGAKWSAETPDEVKALLEMLVSA